MNCKVTVSGSPAEKKFISFGQLDLSSVGFSLKYSLDGDECLLKYDGKSLLQKRRGSVALDLVFEKNRTTTCTIGEGAFCGSFTVFTEDMTVDITDGGIDIKLKYLSGGEEQTLSLTAEKIQEKR